MIDALEPQPASPRRGRPSLVIAGCAIALVCVATYAGTLDGPFVFDDQQAIVGNPTLVDVSSWEVLAPPRETPVAGRPLANLTLALDRARAGLDARAFHRTNALLHALAALLAWLVLRRLLALPSMPEAIQTRAPALALVTALLFAAHPMAVELVLYTTQRTESLAAIAYLGAMLVLLRAHQRGPLRAWPAMAAIGLLGIASKEMFVTAPVMALMLDRAFLAGSFAAALRARAALHAALFSSWLPLFLLQKDDTRPESVRFAELDYLLAQAKIVPEYLMTAVWPARPVFDYGPLTAASAAGGWPWLVGTGLAACVLTALALLRPRAGFVGVWVLLVLVPTSTLLSIHTEVGAERRFYLSLVGVLTVAVLLADAGWRCLAARLAMPPPWLRRGATLAVTCAVAALSLRARAYAERFRDVDVLWAYAAEVRPENPRAHFNLAETLRRQGDADGSQAAFERAITLDPDYVEARVNVAGLLLARGRVAQALEQLGEAVRRDPDDVPSRYNFGVVLGISGRMQETARELGEVVRRDPAHLEARLKLALALVQLGRLPEAREQVRWLARRVPGDPRVAALQSRLATAPAPPL